MFVVLAVKRAEGLTGVPMGMVDGADSKVVVAGPWLPWKPPALTDALQPTTARETASVAVPNLTLPKISLCRRGGDPG
jgi:hypothetical protein